MLINGGEHKSQGWLERRPGPVMSAMGHVNSVEVRTSQGGWNEDLDL